ncbi:hypothetical protein WS87_25480 [Burkholderia sp. MSMB0856]|nr:hypothetical protein WS87_25480 [Burkholderia sp. MSMB0856]KVH34854.1 hypothetical protein WS87_21790 [Burkholderia sp. MSMB0856]
MNVMLTSIPVLPQGSDAPPHDRPVPESAGLRDSPRRAAAVTGAVHIRSHERIVHAGRLVRYAMLRTPAASPSSAIKFFAGDVDSRDRHAS